MVNPFLLASASPRRRSLLSLIGWPFAVQPADINEAPYAGERPENYVVRMAQEKAQAAAVAFEAPAWVLASDTTVVDRGEMLGKPLDAADARRILRQLRGHAHQVMTAIALITPEGQSGYDLCLSSVPMRAYTNEEIEAYVASGDPLDKAGAYAIQHAGFHPVEGFAGCYASVMGLPLCHLKRNAANLGIPTPDDLPDRCQQALGYRCPIYAAVLSGENVG